MTKVGCRPRRNSDEDQHPKRGELDVSPPPHERNKKQDERRWQEVSENETKQHWNVLLLVH